MNHPTALLAASLTAALALAGSVAHADPSARPTKPLAVFKDGMWVRAEGTCGTRQTPPSNFDPARETSPANASGSLQTVYLNKAGGTYVAGGSPTNAGANTISASHWQFGSRNVVIPAATLTGQDWPTIVSCVKEHFKRWNILVTETEPTSGDFIEATFGGKDGSEIGFPVGGNNGALFGIATTDSFCSLYKNGIAFIFEDTHVGAFPAGANRNAEVCNTMVHEVGHVLGLEHLQGPHEHMSYVYINAGGPPSAGGTCTSAPLGLACKDFVDATSGCGTVPGDGPNNGPNNCTCATGQLSSSGVRLSTLIGKRPVETMPPTLTVSAPGDAANLPPTFDVTATAMDETAMQDVAVYVDGVEEDRSAIPAGSAYTLHVTNVTEASHQLKVTATDGAGNETSKTLTITVAKLATGENCIDSDSCHGGICATSATDMFCTEQCTVGTDTCPSGFDCSTVGATAVCTPSPGDGGGCCSASSNGPMGAAGMLALGVGLVLVRRRRR